MRDLGQALSGLADDLNRQQRARRQLAQDLSLQSRIEAMQEAAAFEIRGLHAHDGRAPDPGLGR